MTNHLNALRLRLSNEKKRLSTALSAQEIELRKVWVAQIEKEISSELALHPELDGAAQAMTDDELLAELMDSGPTSV